MRRRDPLYILIINAEHLTGSCSVWEFGRAMMILENSAARGLDTTDAMSYSRNCPNGWTSRSTYYPSTSIAELMENNWPIIEKLKTQYILEWGITNGDYQCISDSLESVGKASLFSTMAKMARTTIRMVVNSEKTPWLQRSCDPVRSTARI